MQKKREDTSKKKKRGRVKKSDSAKAAACDGSGDKSAPRFKASGFHREVSEIYKPSSLPPLPSYTCANTRIYVCGYAESPPPSIVTMNSAWFFQPFPPFSRFTLPSVSPACRPHGMEWRPLAAVRIRNLFPDNKSSSTYAGDFFLYHKSANRDSRT